MYLLDMLVAARDAVTFAEGIPYNGFIGTGRHNSPFGRR